MEDIKFIISELNKPAFNRGLNIVSYDTLRGEQRIEILLKVFDEIDPSFKSDLLRNAEPEEIVSTILDTLRIMKYTPPNDVQPSEFRQSLILGDRSLTTHILWWLLNRLPALKKRAYLSKFLVKIELSPEVEGDHDVLIIYQQYQRMIDEFKTIHNSYENLKKSITSVHEIQRDVKAMEDEREQMTQKLNNIKRRVDVNSNQEYFNLVKEYREEKGKNDTVYTQLQQQDTQSEQIDSKLKRLEQQLKETKNNFQSESSPQDLIDKLEDEVKIKQHMIDEVLPQEMNQLKRYVDDIELIESQPHMSNDYLNKLQTQIQALNREINTIVENKMLNNDPMADKMALFRQNAADVAKKREMSSGSVKTAKQELKDLEKVLKDKRSGLKDGDQPLKGQALKQFVNQLRDKSNEYKLKRNELAEMRTEVQVLNNTLDALKTRDKDLTDQLIKLEEQKGISGYFSMQEKCLNKVNDDNQKLQTNDELRDILRDLSEKINEKKTLLAPVIKDLRPMRQKCQDLQMEYYQRQQAYDSMAAGLESSVGKLEKEVEDLHKQINAMESNQYYIECQLEVMTARQLVLDKEVSLYVAQDAAEQRPDSILHQMQTQLNDQQVMKEQLKQQQKDFKNNETQHRKQLKMWKDLKALMAIKHKCLMQDMDRKAINDYTINARRDHLVL